MVASYINPAPDDIETADIKIWTTMVKEMLINSTHPMLILGDLNANGIKLARKWEEFGTSDVIQGKETWSRLNVTAQCDAVIIRSLEVTDIRL
jgi:hypothetical protein